MNSDLEVVIQQEPTGCGIAAVANIVGKSYAEMQAIANTADIYASDQWLWSDTAYVRRLLALNEVQVSQVESPFVSWDGLPDLALLAIKHRVRDGTPFWHWVVFKRVNGQPFVLDSASYLPSNVRLDFEAMRPAWFIKVFEG